MRVGFWLDWNSRVEDEMRMHRQTLELFVFDEDVTPVHIESERDIAAFDGDMLTFDYGGITGGYGPNPIVPVVIAGVRKWCERNPDRLAVMWCTFEPKWYLQDFKHAGGIPPNLRCWHRTTQDAVANTLREHYAR